MYELDYFYCIKRGEDKIYLRSKASETHNVIGDYEYKEELKNNYKQLNLKLENILSIMTAYYGILLWQRLILVIFFLMTIIIKK
jgi:hypothetical protein